MQQMIKTVRVERFCTKATEVRTSQTLQSEQVTKAKQTQTRFLFATFDKHVFFCIFCTKPTTV